MATAETRAGIPEQNEAARGYHLDKQAAARMTTQQMLAALQTSEQGLSRAEVAERRARCGPNALARERATALLQLRHPLFEVGEHVQRRGQIGSACRGAFSACKAAFSARRAARSSCAVWSVMALSYHAGAAWPANVNSYDLNGSLPGSCLRRGTMSSIR